MGAGLVVAVPGERHAAIGGYVSSAQTLAEQERLTDGTALDAYPNIIYLGSEISQVTYLHKATSLALSPSPPAPGR